MQWLPYNNGYLFNHGLKEPQPAPIIQCSTLQLMKKSGQTHTTYHAEIKPHSSLVQCVSLIYILCL